MKSLNNIVFGLKSHYFVKYLVFADVFLKKLTAKLLNYFLINKYLINKTFVVHIALLIYKILIHLAWETQIALVLAQEIIVSTKNLDFSNIFWKKSAAKIPECFVINKYSIDFQPGKQPPYTPINSLALVGLKVFKIYIKINLANNLIYLFKSLAMAFILFI